MEKVRDLVNTAFANLFPIDEPAEGLNMDVDEYKEKRDTSLTDLIEPQDLLMCEIADEIPF